MTGASTTGVFALAVALTAAVGTAKAADESKYPNWKGQWDAVNPRLGGQGVKFDPTKPFGPAQQAPLTPEHAKQGIRSSSPLLAAIHAMGTRRARRIPPRHV